MASNKVTTNSGLKKFSISPRTKISTKILGIMRNLLVYGFDKSGEQTHSHAFFDIAITHFREFYQLCSTFFW